MKICEDCIKKDVCKFKNEIENYEIEPRLPEPLEPIIICKYKETEPTHPFYYPWGGVYDVPCGVGGATSVPYSELVTTDPCWINW